MNRLGGLINKYIDKPLSFSDIYKVLDNKVRILTYPQLKHFNSIDELLDPYDKCIVLYMIDKNLGHYVSIFRRSNGNIEVYDPYGMWDVDGEMVFVSKKYNEGKYPILSKLIYESPYKYEYNDHHLQAENPNVSTCGMHAIMRLQNTNLSINEYAKVLKSFKKEGFSPDDIVVLNYLNLLKNIKNT
jgi:hypothetical protein